MDTLENQQKTLYKENAVLIEYYATEHEDCQIERALEHFDIKEWFNPEEGYYVLETNDPRVETVFALLGIEWYEVVNTDKSWHEYAFPKDAQGSSLPSIPTIISPKK